jgi:hypothetical protein
MSHQRGSDASARRLQYSEIDQFSLIDSQYYICIFYIYLLFLEFAVPSPQMV